MVSHQSIFINIMTDVIVCTFHESKALVCQDMDVIQTLIDSVNVNTNPRLEEIICEIGVYRC